MPWTTRPASPQWRNYLSFGLLLICILELTVRHTTPPTRGSRVPLRIRTRAHDACQCFFHATHNTGRKQRHGATRIRDCPKGMGTRPVRCAPSTLLSTADQSDAPPARSIPGFGPNQRQNIFIQILAAITMTIYVGFMVRLLLGCDVRGV